MSAPAATPILRVHDLSVVGRREQRPLLHGVSFQVERGGTLGIVGPSGAGKSTLALAVARLLPPDAPLAVTGEVRLGDIRLFSLGDEALRGLRGRHIGVVFQEPALALDPAQPIGAQVAEVAVVHGIAPREAHERAVAMLARVGFRDAARAARRFPHELSGGMRQRALIAGAMLLKPEILIADEPTTALDPTIQTQVLDLIDDLRAEAGTTLLLVSHDLATVAERCARVLALEAGTVVAEGPAAEAIAAHRARRTRPDAHRPAERPARIVAVRERAAAAADADAGPGWPDAAPLLRVRDLTVTYDGPGLLGALAAPTVAVQEVSFSIARGEVVALVGESGCGKTSTAHALLRLVAADQGRVTFDGTDLGALAREPLRRMRRRLQLVPQDAGASLTPHLPCAVLVAEGLEVHGLAHGAAALARARALLEELGLPPRVADTPPPRLSTGERQRVAIARALATDPDLLVCDEPLASVDEASRAQVLAVLEARRAQRGLAVLLISHDLDAVRRLASRVLVMYLGRIVEASEGTDALTAPRMPYTQALVESIPTGESGAVRRRALVVGEPARDGAATAGCAFHDRCRHPRRDARCRDERPELRAVDAAGEAHRVACWHAEPSADA